MILMKIEIRKVVKNNFLILKNKFSLNFMRNDTKLFTFLKFERHSVIDDDEFLMQYFDHILW